MSKERKKIRHELVALLKNKTLAGESVFGARSIPNWHEDLPAVMVYPVSEGVEKFTVAPWEYKRTTGFSVEVIATGSDDDILADTLDDIADQVERAIGLDDSLGGLVEMIEISSIDFDYDATGEQPIGSVTLVFTATYLKAAVENRNEQTDFGEFKKVHADWQIKPLDDAEKEATDDITLR